jgi:hypothetical protein
MAIGWFSTCEYSRPFYDEVISRWSSRGVTFRSYWKVWPAADRQSRVCTFAEYMSTGYLTVRMGLDPTSLSLFIGLMNRGMLRKVTREWRTWAADQAVVRHLPECAATIVQFRENFGAECWTFTFWRFWNKFCRTGGFKIHIDTHVYVPEWMLYRSRITYQRRQNGYADNQRRLHLTRKGLGGLHASFVKLSRLTLQTVMV